MRSDNIGFENHWKRPDPRGRLKAMVLVAGVVDFNSRYKSKIG
jgi:hypothetical protein